jgi:hypothetical protein
MKRYSALLLIVLFSAASAWAAVSPAERTALEAPVTNETVIEKNQAFPLVGPLEVEECLNSDCTLTVG